MSDATTQAQDEAADPVKAEALRLADYLRQGKTSIKGLQEIAANPDEADWRRAAAARVVAKYEALMADDDL